MLRGLLLCILLSVAVLAGDRTGLIVCGGDEVFVLERDGEEIQKSWTWKAGLSPELPAAMVKTFGTTADCKPFGETILIVSSGGGVAWVRRADRAALFYTKVRNAHSACLVPENRVAVASSTGGDEVLVFDAKVSGEKVKYVAGVALEGAHGVVWDAKRKLLWALGTDQLLALRFEGEELKVVKHYALPTRGGHDLSWSGKDVLYISVGKTSYQFGCDEGKFKVFEALAGKEEVKSIDEDPVSGRIVWNQGAKGNWWSNQIFFLNPVEGLAMPKKRIYKVRWDRAGVIP